MKQLMKHFVKRKNSDFTSSLQNSHLPNKMDSKAYIFNFYFLQHLALTPTPSLMTTYRYVSQYRSLSFTAFLCRDEKELVWLPSISFWLYIETYVVCRDCWSLLVYLWG